MESSGCSGEAQPCFSSAGARVRVGENAIRRCAALAARAATTMPPTAALGAARRAASPPRASASASASGSPRSAAPAAPPTNGAAPAAPTSPPPARPFRSSFLQADRPPAPPPAQRGARLLSLGLIADIQTADIPDGASFHGAPRWYRAALDGAERAAHAFASSRVDAVVGLGDLLDAQAAPHAEELVQEVLARLERSGAPTYHTVGNHCLAALGRERVNTHLIPASVLRGGKDACADSAASKADGASQHSFYEVGLAPSLRLVVLDGFHVSLLGWPEGHALREEAASTLAARNPNANKFSADGLVGPDRRYVAFGGGLGAAQLDWFKGRLEDAVAAGARLIIACHLPIHPETAPGVCLLWEYEAVLEAIASVPPGTVIATLAGHSHRDGGWTCADTGTHHRVLASVLETRPGCDCYAVLDLHEDAVVINGAGLAADTWAPVVGGGSGGGRQRR
jgi:manganese-dependent ADP-ribose/CDP-alcohol diphosphatase